MKTRKLSDPKEIIEGYMFCKSFVDQDSLNDILQRLENVSKYGYEKPFLESQLHKLQFIQQVDSVIDSMSDENKIIFRHLIANKLESKLSVREISERLNLSEYKAKKVWNEFEKEFIENLAKLSIKE